MAQQGTYVAGKFDQFKRGVPYASLISAFEQLVGQLVAQPAEVTSAYRARILEAVEAQRAGAHRRHPRPAPAAG